MQFNNLILVNHKHKESFAFSRPLVIKLIKNNYNKVWSCPLNFPKRSMFFMNCSSLNWDLNSIKKSEIITSDLFHTHHPYQKVVCFFWFINLCLIYFFLMNIVILLSKKLFYISKPLTKNCIKVRIMLGNK